MILLSFSGTSEIVLEGGMVILRVLDVLGMIVVPVLDIIFEE